MKQQHGWERVLGFIPLSSVSRSVTSGNPLGEALADQNEKLFEWHYYRREFFRSRQC
jgi:hypothetical protein